MPIDIFSIKPYNSFQLYQPQVVVHPSSEEPITVSVRHCRRSLKRLGPGRRARHPPAFRSTYKVRSLVFLGGETRGGGNRREARRSRLQEGPVRESGNVCAPPGVPISSVLAREPPREPRCKRVGKPAGWLGIFSLRLPAGVIINRRNNQSSNHRCPVCAAESSPVMPGLVSCRSAGGVRGSPPGLPAIIRLLPLLLPPCTSFCRRLFFYPPPLNISRLRRMVEGGTDNARLDSSPASPSQGGRRGPARQVRS